jgi:hypothetical protein
MTFALWTRALEVVRRKGASGAARSRAPAVSLAFPDIRESQHLLFSTMSTDFLS